MKPPNPKNATGKPLQVTHGFRCGGVGYTLTEAGNVRIDGKRDGMQFVKYVTAEQFSDILWEYISGDNNGCI